MSRSSLSDTEARPVTRLARSVLDCHDVPFCDISFGMSDERIRQAVQSSLSTSPPGGDPAQARE
jgi:hypothetical protein